MSQALTLTHATN